MKSDQFRTLKTKLTRCSIYEVEHGFEVQFDIYRKGQLVQPKDEDFGVWAWSYFTFDRALEVASEIEQGKRIIIPMNAQV